MRTPLSKEAKEPAIKFGKQVKCLRKKYGIRQQDLADRANISRVFLSYVETRETSCNLVCLRNIIIALAECDVSEEDIYELLSIVFIS